MNSPKKPFYKRIWFYILGLVAVGVVSLFLIPYGPNGDSIGEQLFDTAEQFSEQYVYDEKEHWGEEEWNEYFDEHEEFSGYVHEDMDWEVNRGLPEETDSRFDQPPHDYAALWGIDFHDLETKERYNVWLDQLEIDDEGNTLEEQYIYREKSTGDLIANVTLDGFILKLDPSYKLGWSYHVKEDANGQLKYRKAANLEIEKMLGGEKCRINIQPYDRTGTFSNETIEHPDFELTMRNEASLSEGKTNRFLLVSSSDFPFDIEHYSIEIETDYNPACFEANLEQEILESMIFLPEELERMPLWGDPDRFPEPRDWPNPNEDEFITIKEVDGKRILEHKDFGIQVELEPEWVVETKSEWGNSFEIKESRRCGVIFNETNKDNLDDWLKEYDEGYSEGLGYSSYTTWEEVNEFPFESKKVNYKLLDLEDGDAKINPNYITHFLGFLSRGKIIEITLSVKSSDAVFQIPENHCSDFNQDITKSIKTLN